MTKPRTTLISLEATAYYHCVSRCVRRAFLCGDDHASGRSFEHRRGWIEERLLELSRVFAIDVCAYAVMANHNHLVLHVDEALAASWSEREVIERWHVLFQGTFQSQSYLAAKALSEVEHGLLTGQVALWRDRLASVSWFMAQLNEHIARKANEEDQCTGRFWEGRFKSQALLDEAALLSCMAYVDLNPIRAALAETPEASDYTSIQRRIQALQAADVEPPAATDVPGFQPPTQPPELLAFVGNEREPMPKGIPFQLREYLELVNWTGQAVRDDKRGAIPQGLPTILERLRIAPAAWMRLATEFESSFCAWVGQPERVHQACHRLGYQRARGIGACRQLFPPS